MDPDFGVIARSKGRIELHELKAALAGDPRFEPFPHRTLMNPFTKQPILASGEGNSYYVADGAKSGNISLQVGKVVTMGVPRAVCEELAARLGAQFRNDDRS